MDIVAVKMPSSRDIDMNPMKRPIEPGPGKGAESEIDAGGETDVAAIVIPRRVVPVVGGIIGIPPGTVNIHRVVDRHIDDLGVDRFYRDIVIVDCHLLLVGRFEIPLRKGLVAQFLDGGHDLRFLPQERISQFPGLVEFIAHGSEKVGEMA
jgi:hypothetical protein